MKIDEVFPQVIGDKAALKDRLLHDLTAIDGLSADDAAACCADIPAPLIDAGAFLDKMTGLWRYEFGAPFEIGGSHVWGAHMWVPVQYLRRAIVTARLRLSPQARAEYYARLNDAAKHAETLAEMIPGDKLSKETGAEFEVPGLGAGNTTVDWVIYHDDRRVLLDVKSRSKDFIEQMENEGSGAVMPEPDHDPSLLFRSVEKKLLAADPSTTLQGVWIGTHIRQHEGKLNDAFAALDASKVHFAILGDWDADIHVLLRREQDRTFLLSLFNATPSKRFTFTPAE